MLRNKLNEVFHKVQQSSSCHQKCRQILVNVYNDTAFEDFETEFMRCIESIFCQDAIHKNVHIERCMEFAATVVTTVVLTAQNENETQSTDDSEDVQTHPLLNAMIENVLQYHNLDYISARYRSCQFINLLLRNLGDDAHIDMDVGNAIQTAMLQRLQDTKPFIRLQAVKALVRLQQPESLDCPVMKALQSHMHEVSALVRKEIVESIAATPAIVPKIVERVRDCDYTVRLAAYRKCAMIGPKLITIVSRQMIVDSGFNEEHELVKRCFLEDTLPKWLSAYNGNFLQLLYALKLDAYEEDLKKTEVISKKVLEVFFKSQQLSEIIECLPIDENKLIPLDKLTTEVVLYWCILTNYLRKCENAEEHLDDIIPELVHFCAYIEKVFKECSTKSMKDWQYLEYQQILCQLFQIVGQYDLGDEVGRRALHKLIVDMLTVGKFNSRVVAQLISILEMINPVLDSLTTDICHIISDIREPLMEQPPSQETVRQNDFKLAELRVKINILNEERNDAVERCDYETAAVVKKQLTELNKKVEDMTAEFEAAKTVIRTSQDDPETLCRCLDILIGMLSHPNLKTLTASLRSCKDEFVVPLLGNSNLEIYQRVYKCIALCCTLDQQMTHENLKLMCTPIIVYRLLPQYDKPILLTSIAAVSDLLRVFGTEIFSGSSSSSNDTNATTISKRRLNGTRRLYTMTQVEDMESVDMDTIACEDIVDILSDMLDDESQELREQAGRALSELLMSRIAVSPSLVSRMILKWFNPVTEKHDQKLQQLLGNTFVYFAQQVEGSEDVLEKAVIPVLTSIGNAPRTSPLADVDLHNAFRFLAAITCIQKQSTIVNTHKNLVHALCSKISSKPQDKCVPLYVKMLLHLELFLEDPIAIRELINQVELILEDVTDRVVKRNVQKFVFKLNQLLQDIANQGENDSVGESNTVNVSEATSVPQELNSSSRVSVPQQFNRSSRTDTSARSSLTEGSKIENNVNGVQNGHTDEENVHCSVSKNKPDSQKNGTAEEIRRSTDRLSNVSLNETPTVKRRKRRGRRSKADSIDAKNSDQTMLHTIIENEHETGSLEDDDLTIQTPTTSPSNSTTSSETRRSRGRPKKVVTSETSSDSEEPKKKTVRRSGRKRKTKKYFS